MYFLGQISFDLYFSRENLKAAILVCLLSVWVLVGLFYYLNHFTRRRYFTIWTVAWLFYALWITLSFGIEKRTHLLFMLELWCIGVSAVFLFWGSERFVGERVRQGLVGWFLVFLLAWSYVSVYHLPLRSALWIEVPLFSLIAIASVITAQSFFKYRRRHKYIGATLRTDGLLLWAIYMGSYPFLENSPDMVSLALFLSAVIQLELAVSMIILVLEEFRTTHQLAVEQIQLRKRERDVLQTKVVSSEERYRVLFEQAGEAIIITEAEEFHILELNRAAERLLGIVREEAGRHSLTAFCQVPHPAGEPPPQGANWVKELHGHRAIKLVRKNGGAAEVEIDAAKIDFDGQSAYQFFVRELTERTRLEQQLRQVEKLSALGQMISGVAHELNNPLAIIKGYLELVLSHHNLPEQTRSNLEKVAYESNRAAKLVRNFLSFAREQPSRRELIDFNELIERMAELRRFEFEEARVELKTELASDLPPTAADPDQFQQVLLNLMSNALHAVTAHKPGKGRIKISTRHTAGKIQVLVEDNGSGVPHDLVAKIFEPFFTTKEVGSGTGLGLSIAHSIMTEHKGKISYQTSSLGGAGFVLEFPVTAAVSPAPAKPPPAKPRILPAAEIEAPSSRVLVLDDERSLAEMLAQVLDILGHTATLCQSPEEALELIDKEYFDLIISDFRMPGLNGRQFYELVKERHPSLARRIIFLTGDMVNEETKKFLVSIGNTYLEKPFSLDTVKKAVTDGLKAVAAQDAQMMGGKKKPAVVRGGPVGKAS